MSDSITVRPLAISKADFESFAHVQSVCFGVDEKEAYNTLMDNPRYNTSHVVATEMNGKLIGTAIMFPAKLWLSGVPLDIGAIAGLGVLPDYRRQGAASQMMELLVKKSAEKGYAFASLFPASPRYYQQFGFGVVGDLHVYRLTPQNIMDFEEKSMVRDFDEADLRMMRVMYKGQMTWHNGWLSRSDEWWDKIIAKWPKIVVFDNDGMIDGYLAYETVTNEQGKTVLKVKEFFAAEGEAFRGLIGYMSSKTDVDIIEYLAPPDTPLKHSLHQPRTIDEVDRGNGYGFNFYDLSHVTVGPMARITTLHTALTKRFYARHMQGQRIIKLTDPFIPENESAVIFRLVDGRAESKIAPPNKTPQIETDIGTFTQILAGYLPAIDAQRLGLLKANEDTCSWLDKAIADSPLYIQSGDWF
ncbi:GNAT family N-acetyltransferase [Anaerolineales bacterium HSG6]|nr:GNAT family N-acetyltransferase [Anaerolineales bacterium HSG6]MDM8531788.1 GNAT family N-acetyltransferase [Anaerolineales bacterium HSG25]